MVNAAVPSPSSLERWINRRRLKLVMVGLFAEWGVWWQGVPGVAVTRRVGREHQLRDRLYPLGGPCRWARVARKVLESPGNPRFAWPAPAAPDRTMCGQPETAKA